MTLLPAQNTFWLSQEKSTGIVSAHRKWTRGTICSFCSLSQSQWASFEKIENRSTRTWSNENSNCPTATIECCRIATLSSAFQHFNPNPSLRCHPSQWHLQWSKQHRDTNCVLKCHYFSEFLKMVSPPHDLFLNISSGNVKVFTLFHHLFSDAQVWRKTLHRPLHSFLPGLTFGCFNCGLFSFASSKIGAQ